MIDFCILIKPRLNIKAKFNFKFMAVVKNHIFLKTYIFIGFYEKYIRDKYKVLLKLRLKDPKIKKT